MRRLVFSAALFAAALHAEEPGSGDAFLPWKWANFVLLVIGLAYLIAKFLPPVFRARTAEIQKGIAEAQAMKKDADRRAAEMEAHLRALGAEIEKFREQARSEMEQEAERIRQATAHQLARLEQQGAQDIDRAGKAARRDLRTYAAKLALDLAERRVRERLDMPAENALVDDFIRDLGASKN